MDAVRDTTSAEETKTTVCRPDGSALGIFWTAIVLEAMLLPCTFANMFLSSSPAWSDELIGLLMFNACLLPLSIVSGLYLRRACIVADVEGLRWRQTGRWRAAAWKDVTAFYGYQQLSSSSQPRLGVKMQTSAGALFLLADEWSSSAELLQSIKKHAREVSGPGLAGPRVKNSILPLSCRYDTSVNRNILRWLDNLHKYGLAAVAVYFALQWFTTHTLPGWEWLLTPTGLFVLVKQAVPLVLRPTYRATQPRLGDKVIADQDSLRFVTTQSDTIIPWADITDLYADGIRWVVVTAEGKYDFLDTLTDAQRLCAIIPRLAVNAGRTGWRQNGGRAGSVRLRQIERSDGQQMVQCYYHYRSKVNHWLFWIPTFAFPFMLGSAFIALQSRSGATAQESQVAYLGVAGIPALLWLWGNYWRCGIRTDDEGITQQTLLGSRRMAWSQVRGLRWRGSGDLTWGYVDGMHGTIKFWKGIGDADRLADEITTHLNTTY